MLRRQRAIEIVPSSKPLRWRRYDVPQHLAPETSDALRFCAVEGDLDLLDRRHRSTIEAGLSSSPRARPWLGCGACGRLLKMSGTLSRGMTILTVSMPTTFGSPVGPRSTTRVERSGFTYTAHAVSTMTRRGVPGIVLTSAHRHYAGDRCQADHDAWLSSMRLRSWPNSCWRPVWPWVAAWLCWAARTGRNSMLVWK